MLISDRQAGLRLMTVEVITVPANLLLTVLLYVSEILRPDRIARMVLAQLALTGLVKAPEAISECSNPAVVTV